MGVPVVVQADLAVDVDGVLEPQPGRVPALPVVPVELRPPEEPPRVPEAEGRPGAPVDEVRPPQEAQSFTSNPADWRRRLVSTRVMPPRYLPNLSCAAVPTRAEAETALRPSGVSHVEAATRAPPLIVVFTLAVEGARASRHPQVLATEAAAPEHVAYENERAAVVRQVGDEFGPV